MRTNDVFPIIKSQTFCTFLTDSNDSADPARRNSINNLPVEGKVWSELADEHNKQHGGKKQRPAPLCCTQLGALLGKRFHYGKRDIKGMIFQLVIPAALGTTN